jgi:hypothetical protein
MKLGAQVVEGIPGSQRRRGHYNEGQGLVQPFASGDGSPPPGDLGYDIAHTPCIP